MTLTALDRVPLDEITAEARQVDVGRVVLTVLAGLLFAIGWVVGRAVLGVAWCAVAVKVGFREGRRRVEAGVQAGSGG